MSPLAFVWFLIIAAFITVYAVLDGFDLGAGFWSLFERDDEGREAIIAAVEPFWDGNEVWLITGSGALFAAFPQAYATLFSAFSPAILLLIVALILRAIAIEFREKLESRPWRRLWDLAFGLGSAAPPVIFGMAAGNLLQGIPLDSSMWSTIGIADFMNPLALLAGAATLALFAAHGAAFLATKTEAALAARWQKRAGAGAIVALNIFAIFLAASAIHHPSLFANFRQFPGLAMIPILALLSLLAAAILSWGQKPKAAFAASALASAMSVATVAAAIFPNIVPSIGNPAFSVTISNSASSALTLKAMLVIAAIGMPLVILYHVWIYRAFRKNG
ncbi:MAG: cytochrome d ubiquinol oxidase subunit II [Pseudomonadota bacterium]